MELQIESALVGDTLNVTCTGRATLESSLRLAKVVCKFAVEKRVYKLLINGLAMTSTLSTLERYELGARMAEHLGSYRVDLRIAVIGVAPAFDGFAVEVARNRDVLVQLFPNIEKGLAWLQQFSPKVANSDNS